MYAKIAMLKGRFDDARGFAESVRADFAKNSTLHPALASACYRLGCIYMQQQDLPKALECFEEALGICQLREVHKGDKGETARVKWRISQIKDMQGEHAEADISRLPTEATYDTLHATGKYTPGVDKEQGFDNLISFLYR
jgi:tetratricopeptide (TPR) repeat protein